MVEEGARVLRLPLVGIFGADLVGLVLFRADRGVLRGQAAIIVAVAVKLAPDGFDDVP